jgi:glycine/D-amino acid oxidase-like deaminating enzyme
MPVRTDTLVIGAGSAGLFCALRWAERGSVTVVESGPDAGDPPPRWALYDVVAPGRRAATTTTAAPAGWATRTPTAPWSGPTSSCSAPAASPWQTRP